MKSTLKLMLLLMVATLLSAAVSCNSDPATGPTPGGSSTDGGTGSCSAGQALCNGSCVDTVSNSQHCGGCGNACGAGQSCQVAVCRCQGGLADCGSGCLSLSSSHAHCGACNNACAPGEVCNRSACAAQCDAGLTDCNGGCTNPLNDPLNCGGCNNVCAAGQTCSAGSCMCSDGSPVCNGVCTNVMTDVNNCGSCGNICPTGQSCSGGVCGGAAVTSTTNASTTAGTPTTTTAGTSSTGAGGSTSTSTTGSTGETPPGWWTYDPENWHGCAWTGIDSTVQGSTTTIMPQEFLTHTPGQPYCVQGTVHDNYEAVALLGFNLNEDPAGADCAYDPASATEVGPPGVTLGGTGLAINFTKSIASTLRVQIQGPNGAIDGGDRWCTTITSVGGKVHIPYDEFYTECWEGAENPVKYANEPISAVVFLVPGAAMGNFTDFDFCINGFATGTSADDAPDGGGDVTVTGTIGGGGSTDNDFQRVKVLADGKEYIIQNNNWGNPESFNQEIRYTNNSFEIIGETGGGLANGVPASFPSIFIGQNGDTQNGLFETLTDPLPIAISSITSLPTTFKYNKTGEGFNASYDVWFSNGMPAPGYDDAGAGFLMIWLHKPSGFNPIGWENGSKGTATLGGNTFNVYVGPRNSGSNPNRPVVNYVAPSSVLSMSFDLKEFIDHAVSNGYGIESGWMLTDVFAGFEIWNGGGTNGLKVEEFTAVVNP